MSLQRDDFTINVGALIAGGRELRPPPSQDTLGFIFRVY